MKAFTNQNARTLDEAVALAQEAIRAGQSVSFAAGGTDLLQLMKDRVVNRPGSGQPDVLVNLKTVDGLDQVISRGQDGVTVGGLTTLGALSEHPVIRDQFTVLAEAAETVATPRSATPAPWRETSFNGLGAGIIATDSLATRPGATSASRSRVRTSSMRSSVVARATLCILRTSRPPSSPSMPRSGS